MDQGEIIDVVREALFMTLQIGLPPMLVGLVIGVIIALFQALTQMQEITLVFVPKIIGIVLTIAILFPTFAQLLIAYMDNVADRIIGL